MKFKIIRGKVLRIVEADSHPHAAAAFWNVPLPDVWRTSGWGGGDGQFNYTGDENEVFVARVRETP